MLSPLCCWIPQNMEVADGISLIIYIQVKIDLLHKYFWLTAVIFDLPVSPTSESIHNSSIVLLDPEPIGISLLTYLLSIIISLESYLSTCQSNIENYMLTLSLRNGDIQFEYLFIYLFIY